MHRVTKESWLTESEWKHGEGHGVVALDRKGAATSALDKMCLLMEVRKHGQRDQAPAPSSSRA
jgi:hypothetical protein